VTTQLHVVRGCDYQAVLRETGIASLTTISAADETARAITLLASFAVELPPAEQAVLRREAVDRLEAIRFDNAARVIGDEIRNARKLAARAARVGRAPIVVVPGDELPEGVEPSTDLAMAHRIARWHGADLRHCPPLGGWYAWDGRVWRRDEAEACRRTQAASVELMRIAADAIEAARDDSARAAATALLNTARKAQAEPAIRRALGLAKVLAPIACSPDAFDRDPWLLTCTNGTLDLRTGKLGSHVREHMITRRAGAAYDVDAPAPTWTGFVERILPDAEVRAFVQRALGYSLTSDTGEQVMFIAHGAGANGKSTLLEAVRHVLGDYTVHVQTDTLMAIGRPRGADNDLMRLRGARFVTAIESGEGKRLDEQRIKSLTGGDTVAARLLYSEPVEFRPGGKIWLATNHRPEVTGTDHAIWRRLRLVPFEVTIPELERDPELPAKLRTELPGILVWMVRGCLEWQRISLSAPDAVKLATESWRADSDELARFIADCCVVSECLRWRSGDLYAAYKAWASAEGNRDPLSSQAFGRRLTDAGHAETRSNGQRYRRGLGLNQEQERASAG
jgi:putative DNA primase/helicase